MRPVSDQFPTSQNFGDMATEGVVGDVNAPQDTVEYWVGLYGNYQPNGHAGMDIACPIGTPIVAPADGTVLYAGWTEDLPPGYGEIRQWLMYFNFGGILTAIQHDGWISFIAHQSDNDMIHVGQRVREGQLIGLSGNTKTRTSYVAPHVHCEALVYMDYRTSPSEGIIYGRVDPRPYFGAISAQGTVTTIQEDEVSADMPMKSKDGAEVTLETVLNSIDTKVSQAAEATKNLPWFDKQVRERLALDAETAARQEAHIAALTEAVSALAAKQDNVDGAAILAAIEKGMAEFKDSYQVTIQRVGKEGA